MYQAVNTWRWPDTMPASLKYPRKHQVLLIFLYQPHLLAYPVNRSLDPPLEPQERRSVYNLSRPPNNLCHVTRTTERYWASPGAPDSWQNEHQREINERANMLGNNQIAGVRKHQYVCSWFCDISSVDLCAFLPTLCGPELVRCAHIAIHYTYLFPHFLYMCFHPPICLGCAVGMLYRRSCPFHGYGASTRTMQACDTR
jgi:hypothetical protein